MGLGLVHEKMDFLTGPTCKAQLQHQNFHEPTLIWIKTQII